MRKLLLIALLCAALPASAFWQSRNSSYNQSVGSGTPFSINYQTSATTTTITAGIATFTSVSIGSADASRIVGILVYLAGNGSSTPTVTAIALSVGATCTASQATSAAAGNPQAASDIWYCAVAAGTTATVAVTVTNTPSRVSIFTFSIVGTGASFSSASGVLNDATKSCAPAAVTVPGGGGTIIGAFGRGATPTGASVSPGSTDASSGSICGTSWCFLGHDTSSSGSTTYTTTFTAPGSFSNACSVATFNP